MAFLQTDFAPSTAPVHVAPVVARSRRPMPFSKPVPQRILTPARTATLGAILTAMALPGYSTFVWTESLALGVLAADFVFLLGVAAWSSVAHR